jgi:hypothetical protein
MWPKLNLESAKSLEILFWDTNCKLFCVYICVCVCVFKFYFLFNIILLQINAVNFVSFFMTPDLLFIASDICWKCYK